jgi:hypothetical protein
MLKLKEKVERKTATKSYTVETDIIVHGLITSRENMTLNK